MTDAVTYADLKFSENLPREIEPFDHEEDNDQSEVTYENVERPSRKEEEAPTAPPVGTSRSPHLKARLQRSSPVLVLLLLVFCLVLLIAAAVMTVKYISVSTETQLTSAGHMELSRKLKDREDLLLSVREELEKRKEELGRNQEELGRRKEELGRSQEENRFLNISLQEAENKVKDLKASKNKMEELEKRKEELEKRKEELEKRKEELEKRKEELEKRKEELMTRLISIQKDLCGEDWTLFGRRCLSFADYPMTWSACRKFCERKKSNIVVVKEEDTELKNLLDGKEESYWVGKEIKDSWTPRWDWPPDYGITDDWYCGKVRAGELDSGSCLKKHDCVCDHNLSQDHCLAYRTWLGSRCLSFSDESMSWNECREFCEKKYSNLLVVKEKDTELKDFLKRRKEYWVGKEITGSRNPRWEWPPDYGISGTWYCGKVVAGELDKGSCKQYNDCICERNLVHVEGLSESSPESS